MTFFFFRALGIDLPCAADQRLSETEQRGWEIYWIKMGKSLRVIFNIQISDCMIKQELLFSESQNNITKKQQNKTIKLAGKQKNKMSELLPTVFYITGHSKSADVVTF